MAIFKKQEKPNSETPQGLQKKVASLEKKLEEMQKELQELNVYVKGTISKIGVMRFNPFKEIGGDQSFCIVLLDGANNGVIITSYYGRELNRVYAKEIEDGASKYELAKEEKRALAQAIGQESQKANTKMQNDREKSKISKI